MWIHIWLKRINLLPGNSRHLFFQPNCKRIMVMSPNVKEFDYDKFSAISWPFFFHICEFLFSQVLNFTILFVFSLKWISYVPKYLSLSVWLAVKPLEPWLYLSVGVLLGGVLKSADLRTHILCWNCGMSLNEFILRTDNFLMPTTLWNSRRTFMCNNRTRVWSPIE